MDSAIELLHYYIPNICYDIDEYMGYSIGSTMQWFNFHHQPHSVYFPACIQYINDRVKTETWYRNGQKHRPFTQQRGYSQVTFGPAHSTYYPNGTLHEQIWYWYGNIHRINAAAHREYTPNGKLKYEIWYNRDVKIKEIIYNQEGHSIFQITY